MRINSRRLVGKGSRAVANTDPARMTTRRRVSRRHDRPLIRTTLYTMLLLSFLLGVTAFGIHAT